MATIKKFEDLIAWQKARILVKYIYALTQKIEFKKDLGLKSQIQRAVVSSMANQAEGFTRGTKIELINYFYIAKASAGEVQSHLYVARDLNYIENLEFQKAYQLAEETQKLIQSFIEKVKAGAWKGLQYKPVEKENWNSAILEEIKEQGSVFTREGVMKKEEAERRGLEPIK
ncbi:four helix bundle protein [Patescibacteria group bacterium]|nr:four helix bundle protein [Patescibacteria group bacterium]